MIEREILLDELQLPDTVIEVGNGIGTQSANIAFPSQRHSLSTVMTPTPRIAEPVNGAPSAAQGHRLSCCTLRVCPVAR